MRLDSDDFELFGLPRRFALDTATLDARWRTLLAEVHPDRHAAGGAAAQRSAMQWAVRVNEAYRRLKDPLQRAAYICNLAGVPIGAEDNTAMPAAFLRQQMEWRESLDEARSAASVDALHAEVGAQRAAALARLGECIDVEADFAGAAREVRGLMFIERFAADVEHRLDALEH